MNKISFSFAKRVTILAAFVVLLLPVTTFAQRRWVKASDIFDDRGRGRNNGRRNQDWKCGKFVNCHDARDGRLDGRGPATSRGVFRNGIFFPRGNRVRNRMIIRNFDRRQRDRLELLRQERIAERRHFGSRWRRP